MATSLRNLLAAIAVALTTAFAGTASAQMAQVPLTPTIVEAFIASYPQVRETTDNLSEQYGIQTGSGENPAAGWGTWLAVTAARSALNAVCQNYGFEDFPAWLSAFTSITTAYIFAREGGGINDQMAAAIAKIRDNPNMPEAQKQMMIQQMQASMGAVGAMMPPQENLDAVAPYAPQLAILFEDG